MPHILNHGLELIANVAPAAFGLTSIFAAFGSWWLARKSWITASTLLAETLQEAEVNIAEIDRLKTDVETIEDAEKRREATQTLDDFATKFAKHKQALEFVKVSLGRKRWYFWPAMPRGLIYPGVSDIHEPVGRRKSHGLWPFVIESLTNIEPPIARANSATGDSKAVGEVK